MLGELPGTTLTVERELGEKSSWTAGTMSMGTIIVDERQPVQTGDGLVLGGAVPPFHLYRIVRILVIVEERVPLFVSKPVAMVIIPGQRLKSLMWCKELM